MIKYGTYRPPQTVKVCGGLYDIGEGGRIVGRIFPVQEKKGLEIFMLMLNAMSLFD